MSHIGQTVVVFPISGSDQQSAIPAGVYMRIVQQVSSASVTIVYHPGHWDNIILGSNIQQQDNQPTQQAVAFEGPMPCYTSPLYIAWFGSGTLSGSCAVLTEYMEQP